MKVDNALIDQLSKLARLEIKEADKEVLRGEMEKMIEFVEQLQNLDTTGAEPLLHMTEEINRLREDKVINECSRADALNAAGNKDQQFFHVPKVIKK